MKFCTGIAVIDIISRAKFSYHRLRGFEIVGVEFPLFPSLALSSLKHSGMCQRVIGLLRVFVASLSYQFSPI